MKTLMMPTILKTESFLKFRSEICERNLKGLDGFSVAVGDLLFLGNVLRDAES